MASSNARIERKKYADVSWGGLLRLTTVLARMPLAALWIYTRSFLFRRNSFRRTSHAALMRWMSNQVPDIGTMQYMIPNSVDAYKTWASANSLPVTVETLSHDTSIMWIGPKRTDCVILYFHGGAYFAPILPAGLAFLHHIQKELNKNGCDVGIAILGYTLLPIDVFPTQIHQAMLATEHILASGVDPSNLHLVGDSAGANLLTGLLSHILHPLDTVRPIIAPKGPIKSVYLMSPWVSLVSASPSMVNEASEDMATCSGLAGAGSMFMASVPAEQRAHAEPIYAPDGWFEGLDAVVERVLVTAGEEELMRDDILQFSDILTKHKAQYTFILQPGGLHDDPILDFMAGVPLDQLTPLTSKAVEWLAAGIKESDR